MKSKTMGIIMWVAVGLVAVGLAINTIWPIFGTTLNDVRNKKPAIPTSSIQQQSIIIEDFYKGTV